MRRPSPQAGVAAQVTVRPVEEVLRAADRPMILAAFGAGVTLIGLACLSIAGLLASRGDHRLTELSVRRALGASRVAIARLVFVEIALLTAMGTVAGIAAAFPLLATTVRLLPEELHVLWTPAVDGRVLAFAALAGMATCAAASLWPVWRTLRSRPSLWLNQATTTPTSRWGTRTVVAGEIALGLGLTVAGTLAVASLMHIWRNDLGFRPDDVLTVEMRLRMAPADAIEELDALSYRVRTRPGVLDVGLVDGPLLAHRASQAALLPPTDAALNATVYQQAITPGFLGVMRPRLVAGRMPAAEEFLSGNVVITEGTANAYWPGRDPIGQTVDSTNGQRFTVAAVVADARYLAWDFPALSFVYVPYGVFARNRTATLLVRTDGRTLPPLDIANVVSAAGGPVRAVRAQMLTDTLNENIRGFRFQTWLFTGVAAASVILVGVGVLGMVAASASRRTREVGVRMALGATRGRVVRLLLTEQLASVSAGILSGGVIAWWSVDLMRHYVYAVTVHDPRVWIASIAVALSTAAVGTLIPAWRSSRINPTDALRAD